MLLDKRTITFLRLSKYVVLAICAWVLFSVLFIQPTILSDLEIFGWDLFFFAHLLEAFISVAVALFVIKLFSRFERSDEA